MFEVGQACELLCGGNHRLIEAIFYENSEKCYETVAWQELKKVKRNFFEKFNVRFDILLLLKQLSTTVLVLYKESFRQLLKLLLKKK
jgi:hypothetical protein